MVLPFREDLVSSEDLLLWLRPFCADDTWPVRPRIQVLQILGQSFNLTEEDGKLLVFFRTEAILKAAWPQRQVRERPTGFCVLSLLKIIGGYFSITLNHPPVNNQLGNADFPLCSSVQLFSS